MLLGNLVCLYLELTEIQFHVNQFRCDFVY